jgi:hypothetical protein
LEENGGSINGTMKALEEVGFKNLDRKSVRQWRDGKANTAAEDRRPGGRPVNSTVESEVLDRLLFNVADKHRTEGQLENIANVAFSYEIIRTAARDVQVLAKWAADARVQALKFTDPWVQGWLQRHDLRRRRVTTSIKNMPSIDAVQAAMEAIQAAAEGGGHVPADRINAEETAVFYRLAPRDQFVPTGVKRGAATGAEDKERFTAMCATNAEGDTLPLFFIIKCTATGPDLSKTRVVHELGAKLRVGQPDGTWGEAIWSHELTLNVKGKPVTALYKRPILVHIPTGTVITCQHKGWMDSVGTCMWAQLVVYPWAVKHGRKPLLIWDNCGPHKVPAVLKVLTDANIKTALLPPNMTDKLQVMDLVINGPLKAAMRRYRVRQLYQQFQAFRAEYLEAEHHNMKLREKQFYNAAQLKKTPEFRPNPVQLWEGVQMPWAAWSLTMILARCGRWVRSWMRWTLSHGRRTKRMS